MENLGLGLGGGEMGGAELPCNTLPKRNKTVFFSALRAEIPFETFHKRHTTHSRMEKFWVWTPH